MEIKTGYLKALAIAVLAALTGVAGLKVGQELERKETTKYTTYPDK